jgi:hypothetical protein
VVAYDTCSMEIRYLISLISTTWYTIAYSAKAASIIKATT